MTVITRKKLIEVALPLEAINTASAREKSIRHGHPSTLHLWWARRPLAAARAVIFAQMVDDPSTYVDTLLGDPAKKRAAERELKKRHAGWLERKGLHEQARQAGDTTVAEPGVEPTLAEVLADLERERLFAVLRELVKWESTTNEAVLQTARDEIWQSWRRACADNAGHPKSTELFDRKKLPGFHDPFGGGGALPLEAQRLGLESYASDLNPVAVLINKAMIEIPPKFSGRPPVNPDSRQATGHSGSWLGAQGLAEDVRYYGRWMRDEAEKRLGHLYPKIEVTSEMAASRSDLMPYQGEQLTVVAWLWARTVRSPNPAFAHVEVPLASSFFLSPMANKEAYVEPEIDTEGYRFVVKVGQPKNPEATKAGTKLARGANFMCLMSGSPISGEYIKAEGMAGRMGARLMAIVAEGVRGRVYLSPTAEHETAARMARPEWKPEVSISGSTQYLGVKPYGMDRFDQLFTDRQVVALTTFAELVVDARSRIQSDAIGAGFTADSTPLHAGGAGAAAYADAVAVYLAFLVSKLADKGSTLCTWDSGPASNRTASGRSARVATVRVTFGRQALPMSWDFAEVNFFSDSVGSMETVLKTLTVPLTYFSPSVLPGRAQQSDARIQTLSNGAVVSTDPPYYDNVPYADLADFFYVWLRRSLQSVFPSLFSTVAVPIEPAT